MRVLGKKKFLARMGARTGATRLVESLPRSPSLVVLNYHRVGDGAATAYDSEVYSCTAADFDWQVGHLKRHFPIVDLAKAIDIVHGRAATSGTSILLTFDDGYRDNYDQAFPILRAHGVSAAFFLPTSLIGTDLLPWWDAVAVIVKNSKKSRIALSYPEAAEFDLTPAFLAKSLESILKLFKLGATEDGERFIRELEEACGVRRPSAGTERSFMNWDEARAMQKGGMRFGSHSHTHEILSKLPYARQLDELRTSRRILESELGGVVDTLAYPDGQRGAFNEETFKALKDAGYTTAFSFYSGVNVPGKIRPYDVLRGGTDGDDRPTFRLRVAMRGATRRELF